MQHLFMSTHVKSFKRGYQGVSATHVSRNNVLSKKRTNKKLRVQTCNTNPYPAMA